MVPRPWRPFVGIPDVARGQHLSLLDSLHATADVHPGLATTTFERSM
jgi:hypothetical protein